MLLGLQLLQLRKIDCIGIWMESIGQCIYLKKNGLLQNIAKEKNTVPDIKKRVCDMLEFDGKQHFSTFENTDSKIKFISDILIK